MSYDFVPHLVNMWRWAHARVDETGAISGAFCIYIQINILTGQDAQPQPVNTRSATLCSSPEVLQSRKVHAPAAPRRSSNSAASSMTRIGYRRELSRGWMYDGQAEDRDVGQGDPERWISNRVSVISKVILGLRPALLIDVPQNCRSSDSRSCGQLDVV